MKRKVFSLARLLLGTGLASLLFTVAASATCYICISGNPEWVSCMSGISGNGRENCYVNCQTTCYCYQSGAYCS